LGNLLLVFRDQIQDNGVNPGTVNPDLGPPIYLSPSFATGIDVAIPNFVSVNLLASQTVMGTVCISANLAAPGPNFSSMMLQPGFATGNTYVAASAT